MYMKRIQQIWLLTMFLFGFVADIILLNKAGDILLHSLPHKQFLDSLIGTLNFRMLLPQHSHETRRCATSMHFRSVSRTSPTSVNRSGEPTPRPRTHRSVFLRYLKLVGVPLCRAFQSVYHFLRERPISLIKFIRSKMYPKHNKNYNEPLVPPNDHYHC